MTCALTGKSRSFDAGLARAVGINAAIVFQHIHHWIGQNRMNPRAWQEGKPWMYQTVAALAEALEVLSPKEVRNAVEKLIDAAYLVKGKFSRHAFDRTTWYRIGENGFHTQAEQIEWETAPKNICRNDDDDSRKSCDVSKRKYDMPLGANAEPERANAMARGGEPIEIDKRDREKERTLTGSTRKRAHDPLLLEVAAQVWLSQEQHEQLVKEHGAVKAGELLTILSNYKLANGKSYKSDFHAIRAWVEQRWEKDHATRVGKAGVSPSVEKNRETISQALQRHQATLREWTIKGRFYCHEASGRELNLEMEPAAFQSALWGICHG